MVVVATSLPKVNVGCTGTFKVLGVRTFPAKDGLVGVGIRVTQVKTDGLYLRAVHLYFWS